MTEWVNPSCTIMPNKIQFNSKLVLWIPSCTYTHRIPSRHLYLISCRVLLMEILNHFFALRFFSFLFWTPYLFIYIHMCAKNILSCASCTKLVSCALLNILAVPVRLLWHICLPNVKTVKIIVIDFQCFKKLIVKIRQNIWIVFVYNRSIAFSIGTHLLSSSLKHCFHTPHLTK